MVIVWSIYSNNQRRIKMTEELNEMMMHAVSQKRCSRCKKTKDLTSENFPRNKSSKDGFSHWCKDCISEHGRIKRAKKADTVDEAG